MELSQIIGYILELLSLLGVGTLMKILITNKMNEKKEQTDEMKALRKKERQQELKEAIQEEMQTVTTEVEEIKSNINKLHESDPLQREALQAILRDRLYSLNRKCTIEKGYTTVEDRENFENMYSKYHTLGANGVMDETHIKFFKLPTEEEFIANNQKDDG